MKIKNISLIILIALGFVFSACGGGSSGGGSSSVEMEIDTVYTVHAGDVIQRETEDATITVTRTQENQNILTTVVLNSGKATLIQQ
ncbi:MAG: hypothetical protein GXO11_03845 [Epsilonproteobacteria bacterium]|nr:hypothetical protein [Campylobacterota bacterium]